MDTNIIEKTLALTAEVIDGKLFNYEDGYVIETYLKSDNSFTARFYYNLDGQLEKTTLI